MMFYFGKGEIPDIKRINLDKLGLYSNTCLLFLLITISRNENKRNKKVFMPCNKSLTECSTNKT
jgi:hypothetical protein